VTCKSGLQKRTVRVVFHRLLDASVAQLVEHHVANVNVEGSNPFARSISIFETSGRQTETIANVFNSFMSFRPFAFCDSLRYVLTRLA
jgi:hypothetical protein